MPSTRINPASIDLASHLLRETYGDLARFGFRGPLTEDVKVRIGKLMLSIVGADGTLSDAERETLAEVGQAFGVSEERAAELLTHDPRSTPIETLVTPEIQGALGCFLYDSIRVARSDGFAEAEREALARVVRRIGVDPTLIPSLEALLDIEDVVRANRSRLLSTPYDLTPHGTGPVVREGVAARFMEYGVPPGPIPRGLLVAWGKAVLSIAAADGELSDKEATWFLGHAKAIGAPDDVLEELLKFDPVGLPARDVIGPQLAPFARTFVFDAVRTARADRLVDRERAAAERGASLLGLDATFVTAVDHQLRVEDALRDARIALVAPR